MGGNFKIRVVENIGEDSDRCVGPIGSIFEVKDGTFRDIQRFPWGNDEEGFSNISQINEYFSYAEGYETEFELVEEE